MEFADFKNEFVSRCKTNNACTTEFKKVLESNDFAELFRIIKNNWQWCCEHEVIDIAFLQQVKADANANNIYMNESSSGYMLIDNATVKASGNATVRAWGNATVEASDNATVKAWGYAFISSWHQIDCKLSEFAVFRNESTKEIVIPTDSYKIIWK